MILQSTLDPSVYDSRDEHALLVGCETISDTDHGELSDAVSYLSARVIAEATFGLHVSWSPFAYEPTFWNSVCPLKLTNVDSSRSALPATKVGSFGTNA